MEAHLVWERAAARPAVGFFLACMLPALTVFVLVGVRVLAHPTRAVVGLNPASDFQVMSWSLRWWPFAIAHG